MLRILIFTVLFCSQQFGFAQTKKVVGYLPQYRFGSSNSIEYCKLTHLNICFANPDVGGNFKMNSFSEIINHAKMQNPNILVCISLGGGVLPEGAKENWLKYIDTPENQPMLISKIIDFVKANQLDGVDFDLEWDAVTSGYSDFVIQLNDSLKKYDKLFTAALPGIYRYPQITNKALAIFDFINIMAYDETGPWNPNKPGQHSSFDFAKQAISYWKNQGMKADKLVLGVPFYGYNFDDLKNITGFSYSDMVKKNVLNADLDNVGEAYYNGMPTIEKKVELAAESVSGIMIWELGQDIYNEYSLLTTIHNKCNALGFTTTGLCGNTVFAENFIESKINIYPNPVVENLYIELAGENVINVSLYDILGRKLNIFPQKRFNKMVLNVSGLKEGIYLLKVESPNFNQSTKIMITSNSN
jgi:hypothetical protein